MTRPRPVAVDAGRVGVAQAVGAVLGNAAGVAISPVPVIALILMLFSRAAARNSLAFLLGWLVGLSAAVLVVLAIGVDSPSGGESGAGGVLQVVVGVLFLGLALRQWRSRPAPGEEAEVPAWMAAVDEFTAVKSLGTGLLLTLANPKNLGLAVAAAASISGAGLGAGSELVAAAVYVLVSSVTVVLPVLAYLVAGDRATPALTSTKEWLTANNATVMTVLFAVLGAKVLGDGLGVLA